MDIRWGYSIFFKKALFAGLKGNKMTSNMLGPPMLIHNVTCNHIGPLYMLAFRLAKPLATNDALGQRHISTVFVPVAWHKHEVDARGFLIYKLTWNPKKGSPRKRTPWARALCAFLWFYSQTRYAWDFSKTQKPRENLEQKRLPPPSQEMWHSLGCSFFWFLEVFHTFPTNAPKAPRKIFF